MEAFWGMKSPLKPAPNGAFFPSPASLLANFVHFSASSMPREVFPATFFPGRVTGRVERTTFFSSGVTGDPELTTKFPRGAIGEAEMTTFFSMPVTGGVSSATVCPGNVTGRVERTAFFPVPGTRRKILATFFSPGVTGAVKMTTRISGGGRKPGRWTAGNSRADAEAQRELVLAGDDVRSLCSMKPRSRMRLVTSSPTLAVISLNPQRSTLNPSASALNLQPSTLNPSA